MLGKSASVVVRKVRRAVSAVAMLVMMAGCGEETLGPHFENDPDPDPDPLAASGRIVLHVGERDLVFEGLNVDEPTYSDGVFTIGGSQPLGTSGYYAVFSLSVAADRPGTYDAPPGLTANQLWWWDFTAGSEFMGSTVFDGSGGRIFVDSLSENAISGRFEGMLLCNCEAGTAVELSGSFSAAI